MGGGGNVLDCCWGQGWSAAQLSQLEYDPHLDDCKVRQTMQYVTSKHTDACEACPTQCTWLLDHGIFGICAGFTCCTNLMMAASLTCTADCYALEKAEAQLCAQLTAAGAYPSSR